MEVITDERATTPDPVQHRLVAPKPSPSTVKTVDRSLGPDVGDSAASVPPGDLLGPCGVKLPSSPMPAAGSYRKPSPLSTKSWPSRLRLTLTRPSKPGGDVHSAVLDVTTRASTTAAAPNLHQADKDGMKLRPLRVTVLPPATMPDEGLSATNKAASRYMKGTPAVVARAPDEYMSCRSQDPASDRGGDVQVSNECETATLSTATVPGSCCREHAKRQRSGCIDSPSPNTDTEVPPADGPLEGNSPTTDKVSV